MVKMLVVVGVIMVKMLVVVVILVEMLVVVILVKMLVVGNSLIGFLSKLLFFCEQKSYLLVKRANCSSRYFVMSDGSEWLMISPF